MALRISHRIIREANSDKLAQWSFPAIYPLTRLFSTLKVSHDLIFHPILMPFCTNVYAWKYYRLVKKNMCSQNIFWRNGPIIKTTEKKNVQNVYTN